VECWRPAVTILLGIGAVWSTSGTQRERPMLAGSTGAARTVRDLEACGSARTADGPFSPGGARDLMQAYLDAHQPGLAIVLFEAASARTRSDLRVRHVYARALMDQGRNAEALATEQAVIADCRFEVDGESAFSTGCDGVLFVAAVRRVDILHALVAFGIEDAQGHPEASLAAYQCATREARIVLE